MTTKTYDNELPVFTDEGGDDGLPIFNEPVKKKEESPFSFQRQLPRGSGLSAKQSDSEAPFFSAGKKMAERDAYAKNYETNQAAASQVDKYPGTLRYDMNIESAENETGQYITLQREQTSLHHAAGISLGGNINVDRKAYIEEQKKLRDQVLQKNQQLKQAADKSREQVKGNLDRNIEYVTQNLDEFTTTSAEGDKVPDVNRINDYAKIKAEGYGLSDEGYYKNLLYNEVKANVAHKIIEPKVLETFNKNYKEKYGTTPEEETQKEAVKGFVKGEAIKNKAQLQVKGIFDNISTEAKSEVEALNNAVNQEAEAIKSQYEQAAPMVQTEDQAKQLHSEAVASIDKLNKGFLKQQNTINSKYNARYRRQVAEIEKMATAKIKEELEKYEYKRSPDLQKRIESEYRAAYEQVLKEKGEFLEQRDRSLNPVVNFGRTLVTSLGGAIKGISSSMDFDTGKVFGDYLSELSQHGSTEIKSFRDLLDVNKMSKSMGSLAGGMAPSLIAAGATTLATQGAGAPQALTLLAGGFASWAAETSQMAGQVYEDKFAETGDAAKSEYAAKQTLDSQVLLMPLYAFDGLPFMGKAVKLGKNVPTRILLGGTIELGTEFGQEYPQNLFEEAIRNDRPYMEGLNLSSIERAKNTFLNIAPTFLLGGSGQGVGAIREAREKHLAKAAGKTFALKSDFKDMPVNFQDQYLLDIFQRKGKPFTTAFVGSLFSNGTIDEAQSAKLTETINTVEQTLANSEKYGLNPAQQKVYGSFALKRAEAMASVEAETDPILKIAAQQKIANIENDMVAIATGEKADYTVVTMPNNEQYVMTQKEAEKALGDYEFLDAYTNGDIKIQTYGKRGAVQEKLDELDAETKKLKEAEAMNPEDVILNAAKEGHFGGMAGESVISGATTPRQAILELAMQKYGVLGDGSVDEKGGRDISMKTSIAVDEVVTKAYPNQKAVVDAIQKASPMETAAVEQQEGAAEDVVPSTLKDELLDNYEVNDVEIPDGIESESNWQEKLVDKAFSDMGLNPHKKTAGTGTIYYTFKDKNGEDIVVRLGDHSKGRWAGREVEANVVYDKNSSPRDVLDILRDKLPDGKIVKPPKQQTKPIEPVSETKETTTEIPFQTEAESTTPPTPPEIIPPTEEGSGGKGGNETIGITHADMDAVANELGLPTYEKDPQTEEQWIAEADQRLANGEMLPIIRKMESDPNYQPGPVETTMAKRYIASLKARINKKPTQELLKELDRAKNAFNLAGRVWGQTGKARQGTIQVQDTLADYLLDRGGDKGHPLTDEQIKTETEKYNKLKEEKEKLEEALLKEKEAYAKLAAEKGINRAKAAAKKASKKTHEQRVEERNKLAQSIRDKWSSAGKDILSSDIPFRKQLAAIAPDVKRYAESLIGDGIDRLDNMITAIHAEFKDILDKPSILDILAGDYDKKERTKSQKANELRLIQREAELLKQLANERKGIEKEKSEVVKDKKSRRIIELEDKIKEVRQLNKEREARAVVEQNELPFDYTEEELKDIEFDEKRQKQLEKRKEKLEDDIKNKKYEPEPKQEVQFKKSYKTQQLEDGVINLENQLNHERIKDRLAKRTKAQKWYDFITREILGVRRLANTILDLSIWLRQTVRLAFNPRKWDVFGKEIAKSWNATWSQKKFDRYMNEIHKDPEFDHMTKDGIRFNEFETNEVAKENEFYYKNWLFKIPYLRQLPLASQRAADAALNVARYELYKKYRRNLENSGVTRESDPKVYEWMAAEVMNQTGSGKLLKMFENNQAAQKVLGNTLYGARLMAANFNQLNPAYYIKMPKEVRQLIWKDIASYVGMTMATGLALVAMGATVSFDEEDPDFLQVRFGGKVYDITGGKAAYIRTALRILRAAFTSAKSITGDVSKHEVSKSWKFASESTLRFFRNKLAPNTGYAYTWTFGGGKNAIGQDANPLEVFQLYPMYFDDAYEGFRDDGLISIATVLAPNILGVGYNNYFSDPALKPIDDLLQRNMQSDEMDLSKYRNYKQNKFKGKELTKEDREKFIKARDNYIGERLTKFFERGLPVVENKKTVIKSFQDLSKDQIIAETSKIKSAATRTVKQQLFGDDEDTDQEIDEKDKIEESYEKLYKEYYK